MGVPSWMILKTRIQESDDEKFETHFRSTKEGYVIALKIDQCHDLKKIKKNITVVFSI